MSAVAADNPYAWRRDVLSPEAALSEAGGNRIITWPYNKCMNAIAGVDMAAAVLLTTVGEARRQGIDPSRWVYLHGGAEANDVWYAAEREDFHRSPALAAAGAQALAQAGIGIEAIDRFDLYSCFPSAVTVACDSLGIAVGPVRSLDAFQGPQPRPMASEMMLRSADAAPGAETYVTGDLVFESRVNATFDLIVPGA